VQLATPAAPALAEVTTSSISVTYTPDVHAVSTTITLYNETTSTSVTFSDANTGSHTFTGLIPADSYHATITTIGDGTHYLTSSEGNASATLNLSSEQLTRPTAPTLAKVSSTSISVAYSPNGHALSTTITLYNETTSTSVTISDANTGSHTFTGLIPADSYHATITAIGDGTHYTTSVEGSASATLDLGNAQLATPVAPILAALTTTSISVTYIHDANAVSTTITLYDQTASTSVTFSDANSGTHTFTGLVLGDSYDATTISVGDGTHYTTSSEGAVSATVVLTSAPSISSASISGNAIVGQVLSAHATGVSGTPFPNINLQWFDNGVPIDGATGATYVVTSADIGDVITVSVTLNNSLGTVAATSSATAVVAPPSNPATPPSNVNASAGDTTAVVSWIAPSSDGGSTILSYTVTSSPGSRTCTASGASATSCVVTGLSDGTSYTFSVVATTAAGASGSSQSSAVVTPSFTINQVSTTSGSVATTASATLTAQVLADDPSGTVTFAKTGGSSGLVISSSGLISTTGPLPGSTYTISGTMSDAANGGSGTFTFTCTVLTAAPAFTSPFTQTAVAGASGTFDVVSTGTLSPSYSGTYSAPGAAPSALPGGVSFVASGASGTLTVDASAPAGTYQFTFTSASGGGIATQVLTLTLVANDAPSSVVAVAGSTPGTVDLNWIAPAGVTVTLISVTPFDLTAGVAGTPQDVSATTLSIEMSGLNSGDTYQFNVTAWNDGTQMGTGTSNATLPVVATPSQSSVGGTSTSSSGVSVASLGTPGTSGSITASAIGQGTLSVASYTSNPVSSVVPGLSNETSYDVKVSPGSNFSSVTFEICGVMNATIAWFNSLTGQMVPVSPTPTLVAGLPGCYVVTLSPTSTPSSTSSDLYGSIIFVLPAAFIPHPTIYVPGAPKVSVATVGDSYVSVIVVPPINDGGSPIVSYTVTASPGGATCVAHAPNNVCQVTGLANGVSYTFSAFATNKAGASLPSTTSTGVTPFSLLDDPTSVTVRPGKNLALVSWSLPKGGSGGGVNAIGYLVTSIPQGFNCTTVSATSCVFTGLIVGASYKFEVRTILNGVNGGSPYLSEPTLSPQVLIASVPSTTAISLLNFQGSSVALTSQQKAQISVLALTIFLNQYTSVQITGYANSQKTSIGNLYLALERANQAANVLALDLRALNYQRVIFVKVGKVGAKKKGSTAPTVSRINVSAR
jgi:hypothetical protein